MADGPARGRLRLYLGAAPGVGKTFAMLSEGHRRAARGAKVLVALADTHGRMTVDALLDGLEVLATQPTRNAGGVPAFVDVDEALRRAPDVVLVDDLARANPPDAANPTRWQDVERLLAAGIDVVSTVDIAELESLADVVESITGVAPTESVPDRVVRSAEQVELVDMAPEALRRRLAHGNIYPADRVDAALSRYFRPGNLAALRELALLWLADRVDEGLERYRHDHDIAQVWAARERVLVALTGGPEGDVLLRRGARIASRGAGGELHAVYVSGTGSQAAADEVARLRAVTEELGGTHHTVVGDDAAEAVLQLARAVNATQVVIGASGRPRWRALLRSGVSERIIAGSGDIDVLVVPRPSATQPAREERRGSALSPARVATGWVLALVGPVLLSVVLVPSPDLSRLAVEAMSFLALTVACALVGGLWPAVTAAVAGSLLLNWFFIPPSNTLDVAETVDVLALALFLLVAVAVASVVDKAARRSLAARTATREADLLMMLNRSMLRSDRDVHTLLELVRDAFSVSAAALLRADGTGWQQLASAGEQPPAAPADADTTAEVAEGLVLALRGEPQAARDRRVLAAFATHLAVALEHEELAERAAEVRRLEEGNRVRTALLAAVSHDLRTPLAGIKAAVSSLRSADVRWSPEEEAELLATVESSADRLHDIVTNLLDLSRLQAEAVQPVLREVGLDDVLARATAGLPTGGPPTADRLELRLPADLPAVLTDAGLLERVVANLVDNALEHAPSTRPVVLAASHAGGRVQLRVIDRGPGVPDREKSRMFDAFQRLGDESGPRSGLGLGLAVAKGLTEALGGSLLAEDTPGGGLTMVVDLPAARAPAEPLSEAARP